MNSVRKSKLRFLYVTWAFFECIGFGGLIFGWGSFVYILKDEGLYMDLCDYGNITDNGSNSTLDCPEQESRLELVFAIGSMCSGIGSFVLGQINFSFGLRVSRIVATLCFMCGAITTAFTSNDIPWLIFPGMALVAFGGISMILTNVQLSNLFPVGGGAVVGIISGAFDTSAGIQLLAKIGYEHGISRQTSYLVLACTHVLTFVSTFLFLPKHYIPTVEEENIVNQEIELQSSDNSHEKPDIKKEESAANAVNNDNKEVNFRSLMAHVFSPTFYLHVVWMSFLQLRLFFFLGSINRNLEKQLVFKEKVSDYTNTMLYILMSAIVVAPLAGGFLELNILMFKKKKSEMSKAVQPSVLPLTLTSTLCLALSVLVLFEDPSHLYYIFVLLVFFRSFLYTTLNAYIVRSFPSAFIGSLIGICTIVSGVFSLLQYALFEWTSRQVNILLIVLVCLSYAHPLWQWVACKRTELRQTKS